MARENVAVLKRAQRHLCAPDRRGVRRRVGDAEFSGNLQRIPKLLRRDANAMEALGHIDGAGLDNGPSETGCATRKPLSQRAPPCTLFSGDRLVHQLAKLPSKPIRVEFRKPAQQLVTPRLPGQLHVLPRVGQDRPGGF